MFSCVNKTYINIFNVLFYGARNDESELLTMLHLS